MRVLLVATIVSLSVAPARSGWFGTYEKYVSPQGDFELEMPKGWIAEQYLGDVKSGSKWYEPNYGPNYDKKFHHAETIFSDPGHLERMLVVRYREYGRGFYTRDGMIEFSGDLQDYLRGLRVTYGVNTRPDAAVDWSDSAAQEGAQMAFRTLNWPLEDREQQVCNARTMYGVGIDPIHKTCNGATHYHTVLNRKAGVYDLVYPAPIDAAEEVMHHYRRLMSSFKVLRDGGPDAPPAPPAPVAPKPDVAAAPKPAIVESEVDAPRYSGSKRPDDFALVVGVEDYDRLPKATNAAHDADAVRKHLLALGFPERNIILLRNRDAVRSRLAAYLEEWLPKNAGTKSTVFFYYSGHGAPDLKTGAAYLVPSDGDATFLQSTAFPVKQLYADLAKLPAKRVIVALDACFSGAGGRSVIAEGARPLVAKPADLSPSGKLSVLAAASGEEITGSLDAQGHGLFTYYLLKGLADGKRSTAALLDYAKPRVQDEARRQNREQTPVLLGPDAPL